MSRHLWKDVSKEQFNPLVKRQTIHSEGMTLARFELSKGALVPQHSHSNEQFTTVISGRLKFVFPGKDVVVHPGESLHIAPNLPHSAEALEDCVAIDVFSPPRADWIRGD